MVGGPGAPWPLPTAVSRAALEAATTANGGKDLSKCEAIRGSKSAVVPPHIYYHAKLKRGVRRELAWRGLPDISSEAEDLRGFLRWEERELNNVSVLPFIDL